MAGLFRKRKLIMPMNALCSKNARYGGAVLGANVGDEQDGKGQSFSRPVLVLKKFNRNVLIGIPLSTQLKDKPYYYKFHFKGIEQSLILSQIRLMDAKRFRDKMGDVPSHEMEKIKEKLKKLIF